MKTSTLVLALSFAGNAALIGMIAIGAQSDPAPPPHPALTVTKPAAGDDLGASPAAWVELHSDNFATQRDRLKAAGFPIDVIRAILGAEIKESFSARMKALESAQAETPFWKNPVRDPKAQAAIRELYKEQEKLMKDLLGRDGRSDDPTYVAYLKRQFGDLPDDKVEQLRQISDDYNGRRSDIYSGGVAMLPEERQKIADLDKAMHADFAGVLTPQELEAYDLRASSTAQNLRYNLAAFDATEDEYHTLYKLQAAFDDKYRMMGPLSQDEMKARSEAQKQLNDDIKTALGDTRYTDYQRATDYNYRQVTQLVARLELPPENATALWSMQKDIEKRRGEIYSPATAPAERTAQLTALQQEAVSKITPLLGGDASRVEIYKQNGGQWLQSLTPRPAVPPRP